MQHKPTIFDFLLMLGVSLLWGSSFMFIKIGLETFEPFSLAATRIVLAGAFMYIVARVRGEVFPTDAPTLKRLAMMGLCGTAPFILISWAQQYIESSLAAIVMGVAPLNILLLAHFMTDDEKLTARKIFGLALGFVGVLVLFGGITAEDFKTSGLGMLAVFVGTVLYAFGSIMIRRLAHVSATVTAAGFLIMASVVVLPLSLVFDPPWHHQFTWRGGMALVFLGIFSSGLASLFLVSLIKRAGVTFASYCNYLTPLIAVAWGLAFLGEAVSPKMLIALTLILCGLAVTNAKIGRRKGAKGSGIEVR